MSRPVFLDTNVVLWIAKGQKDKLSRKAVQTVERHTLLYSPMVRLEIEYLFESRKITQASDAVLKTLQAALAIAESETGFSEVCRQACRIGWTREAFDRLIVAEAMVHDAPLLTADEEMLTHYRRAVW